MFDRADDSKRVVVAGSFGLDETSAKGGPVYLCTPGVAACISCVVAACDVENLNHGHPQYFSNSRTTMQRALGSRLLIVSKFGGTTCRYADSSENSRSCSIPLDN